MKVEVKICVSGSKILKDGMRYDAYYDHSFQAELLEMKVGEIMKFIKGFVKRGVKKVEWEIARCE